MKMNKKYVAPEIDMVLLNAMDVITLSGSDGDDDWKDDPFAPLGM